MGVVIEMTNFCHLQCDGLNCGKKMHHYGEQILTQMAILLGWENRGAQWLCPHCAKGSVQEPRKGSTTEKAVESPIP